MALIWIFGVGLVLALAICAVGAFYLGLLGVVGARRAVRCDRCGHWGWTSSSRSLRSCTRCEHGRLFHPINTLRHAHHAEDAGSDSLHPT